MHINRWQPLLLLFFVFPQLHKVTLHYLPAIVCILKVKECTSMHYYVCLSLAFDFFFIHVPASLCLLSCVTQPINRGPKKIK